MKLSTFRRKQRASDVIAPANWKYVGGIGVDPEIVALRIAVEVQEESLRQYLGHSDDAEQWLMIRIDGFDFHPGLETWQFFGHLLEIGMRT